MDVFQCKSRVGACCSRISIWLWSFTYHFFFKMCFPVEREGCSLAVQSECWKVKADQGSKQVEGSKQEGIAVWIVLLSQLHSCPEDPNRNRRRSLCCCNVTVTATTFPCSRTKHEYVLSINPPQKLRNLNCWNQMFVLMVGCSYMYWNTSTYQVWVTVRFWWVVAEVGC